MKVVIALGNPGEKYERTRHNAGWLVLDEYLAGETWRHEKRFEALVCEKGGIIFAKPLTFMNESGRSARKILSYYHLLPRFMGITKKGADLSDVLAVIHDDIDLELGKNKLDKGRSSAGHKGVQSIITELKTKDFSRLRIGIKNDLAKTVIPTLSFVLQRFSGEELETIKKASSQVSELAR